MGQLTLNELNVIANLIGRTQINGNEATTVAILLQKINTLIQSAQSEPMTSTPEETTKK